MNRTDEMHRAKDNTAGRSPHRLRPAKLIVCLILAAAFFVLFLPDSVVGRSKREEALRGQCLENLRALSEVCRKFALVQNGNFPSAAYQSKNIGAVLKEQGFLRNESVICCPSTRTRFPKTSFCFIPGVRQGMSPKMPCVIEKITNHDRMIGVIYVDGSVEQISHECRNYIDLLPLFSGRITSDEKKLLETHLKRLDIP